MPIIAATDIMDTAAKNAGLNTGIDYGNIIHEHVREGLHGVPGYSGSSVGCRVLPGQA
jgi:hypothetical protein